MRPTAMRQWREASALGDMIRVGQEPSTHCAAQELPTVKEKKS